MNELAYLSVITVTGRDADAFLHNQLTSAVRTLDAGTARFAALCQPKGRVMALLLVCAVEDGYRIVCHRGLAQGLVSHLRRFIFRDQVDLQLSDEFVVVGDVAQGAAETELTVTPLPGLSYGLVRAGGDRVPPIDGWDFRARELGAGVAWLDGVTAEQFLPQMLGLETIGALDFRKGCFPGQEVIARTRYLGKLKRHPWSGRLDGRLPVAPMETVELSGAGETASGVLVDQAPLAGGEWQAFLVVRRTEAFDVDSVSAGDIRRAASGRWLNEESGVTPTG